MNFARDFLQFRLGKGDGITDGSIPGSLVLFVDRSNWMGRWDLFLISSQSKIKCFMLCVPCADDDEVIHWLDL